MAVTKRFSAGSNATHLKKLLQVLFKKEASISHEAMCVSDELRKILEEKLLATIQAAYDRERPSTKTLKVHHVAAGLYGLIPAKNAASVNKKAAQALKRFEASKQAPAVDAA